MTTPDAPGNNDDIIKVVYQAVADYSQLLRETRRAREETNALKRDLDGLAGTSTHRVKVTVDSAQARSEIAAVLRDVVVKAKVTVDAAAARTELGALLKDVVVKAKVVVDAAAKSQLTDRLKDTVVKVQVAVDAAAARAELRRTFADNIIIGGKLVVDTVAARAEIARATRDATIKVRVLPDVSRINNLAGFFADKVVKVTVALDEAGITERFRALLAHLESMGPVEIELAIKQSAIDRIDAAAERLRRIRDEVQSGGGGPPDPAPPRPAPPRGGGGSSSSSNKELPSALTGAAGLVLKFVPLIAAAVPVAAALTVGVGALAAAFVAAGATAGIFALAAAGALSKVTDAVKAYEKSGTIAEGPLGRVVGEVEALKARYGELEKATQADVFAVFSRGLQIAVDLLDKVQDLVGGAARAVDGALAQVQRAIDGPGFEQFLDFLDREGPTAVAGFTRGLLGLGGGVGRLFMAFEPLINLVVSGFADMGESFDRWASQLDSNRGFQQFVQYGERELPRLIDLIKSLAVFAGHLFTALQPLGSVLLGAAAGALHLLNAINPSGLGAIITVVLALAVAVKALQAAIAVQAGLSKFQALIASLPGVLGRATAGITGVRAAMLALGTATVIGVAITAIVVLLSKLGQAQRDAAAAAKAHSDAVRDFGQQLAGNNGIIDENTKKLRLQKLYETDITGKTGTTFGLGGTQVQTTVGDVAAQAGISNEELTAGTTGDKAARSNVYGRLLGFGQAQRKAADTGVDAQGKQLTKEQQEQALALADAADKAADSYLQLSPNIEDAAKWAKEYGVSTDGAVTATKSAVDAAGALNGKLTTQAGLHKALAQALGADFSTGDAEQKYAAATQALDAYDQQVQAQKDAELALSDAQTAATRAQEDLNQARKDAVQRIRDLQRSLRDMAVDERQAKLSAKESDENLAKLYANGASADEIEQAKIDNERAHNALNDLEQDKGDKKKSIVDELAKGTAGNRALQDAIRSNQTAQSNLTKAHTNLTTATTKLIDLHLAFQTAAGALGLSDGQVRKLKGAVDSLKSKTVNVVVDTKKADEALTKLLQGQYALQLTMQGVPFDKAMAEALTHVPSLAAATTAKKPAAAPAYQNMNPNVATGGGISYNVPIPGRAEGGPTPSPVTAGPVRGPGGGTSDSVLARLPVGGPARLSDGEHIVTDAEVKAAPGGHNYLEAFRAGLRAGRPWAPPAPRYAGGGRAVPPPAVWSAALPTFRVPVSTPPAVPGYAGGGAVATAARTITSLDRSVTVNVGTINNPTAEPAGTSLYKQVRKAIEGDEGGR